MGICIYCLGKKAFMALEQLDAAYHTAIDLVVIGTDENIREDHSAQIKEWAAAKKIACCYRNELTAKANISTQHIALGWRWLINIDTPQQLFVFHDSLLPKYRGFNPLVTALLNGDTEIGATCFLAEAAYDAGPVVVQKKITIQYPIKIDTAITVIGNVYAAMLNELFFLIQQGKEISTVKQKEEKASYSLWRDEADYQIDWKQAATYIQRFVDGVGYPYKGAFFFFENKKIRVVEVELMDDVSIENRCAGKLFKMHNDKPVVVCGTGLIVIKKMVDEEGKPFRLGSFRVRL